MKIRTGFVSNSSSSSFTVRTKDYPCTFDLAQDMVLCRNFKEDEALFNKIESDKNKMNPNSNISFLSCNYDTFIVQIDDFYVVQTCNNHDWGKIRRTTTFPLELEHKGLQLGYDGAYDYCEFHLSDDYEFWYPELDVWGHTLPLSWPARKKLGECEDHPWSDIVETDDNVLLCRICKRILSF